MDDVLDPKELEEEEVEEEFEEGADSLLPGKKKSKAAVEYDSLDALAEEEDELLPEDSYDDLDLL